MKDTSAYILNEVKTAIEKVDDSKVDEIVDAIIAAKTIFIYGVGRSGLVGQVLRRPPGADGTGRALRR